MAETEAATGLAGAVAAKDPVVTVEGETAIGTELAAGATGTVGETAIGTELAAGGTEPEAAGAADDGLSAGGGTTAEGTELTPAVGAEPGVAATGTELALDAEGGSGGTEPAPAAGAPDAIGGTELALAATGEGDETRLPVTLPMMPVPRPLKGAPSGTAASVTTMRAAFDSGTPSSGSSLRKSRR
ncbi:MAG: hypothetical protein KBC36_10095 [Spirochaetia bacterium]|nr:hypothetical protein [Spirochaetia bacterium]